MSGKIIIWGNRTGCGLTRALWKIASTDEFFNKLQAKGITAIGDADGTDNKTLYASVRTKYSLAGSPFPYIIVTDNNGKMLGKFVARAQYIKPFTADKIIAKIMTYCPSCSDTEDVVVPPVDNTKRCPKCGYVLS